MDVVQRSRVVHPSETLARTRLGTCINITEEGDCVRYFASVTGIVLCKWEELGNKLF